MGATITLRCGEASRTLLLEDFFIDYGKQDRESGDFVESIHIPIPQPDAIFAVHKISKRRDEDISSVCGAFHLQVKNETIVSAVIAFGGMAATPKRASTVEKALTGNPWSEETIRNAMACFEKDFAPISDWRASAEYRMTVAKNLLYRTYLETEEGTHTTRLQPHVGQHNG